MRSYLNGMILNVSTKQQNCRFLITQINIFAVVQSRVSDRVLRRRSAAEYASRVVRTHAERRCVIYRQDSTQSLNENTADILQQISLNSYVSHAMSCNSQNVNDVNATYTNHILKYSELQQSK